MVVAAGHFHQDRHVGRFPRLEGRRWRQALQERHRLCSCRTRHLRSCQRRANAGYIEGHENRARLGPKEKECQT